MSKRFLLLAALCAGCTPGPGQPWRAALDDGKVIKLDGTVGKLAPPPEMPIASPPNVSTPKNSTASVPVAPPKGSVVDDPFPIPPPPKGVDGKPRLVVPVEEEKTPKSTK